MTTLNNKLDAALISSVMAVFSESSEKVGDTIEKLELNVLVIAGLIKSGQLIRKTPYYEFLKTEEELRKNIAEMLETLDVLSETMRGKIEKIVPTDRG